MDIAAEYSRAERPWPAEWRAGIVPSGEGPSRRVASTIDRHVRARSKARLGDADARPTRSSAPSPMRIVARWPARCGPATAGVAELRWAAITLATMALLGVGAASRPRERRLRPRSSLRRPAAILVGPRLEPLRFAVGRSTPLRHLSARGPCGRDPRRGLTDVATLHVGGCAARHAGHGLRRADPGFVIAAAVISGASIGVLAAHAARRRRPGDDPQ